MNRHVRNLRVSCRHREHAGHARIQIEDALRTATLNDDARLIVVRRVSLGTLPLNASSTAWSRRLETRFGELRDNIVSAEHPSAAHADAVYFQDTHEPWMCLAARAARGQPLSEWFWPKVAPSSSPGLSREELLRLAFRTLAKKSPVLALELLQRLGKMGVASQLLQALETADVSLALPEASTAFPDAASDHAGVPVAAFTAILAGMPWVLPVLRQLPDRSPKALLVAATVLAASGLPLPKSPPLAAITLALVASAKSQVSSIAGEAPGKTAANSRARGPRTESQRKLELTSSDERCQHGESKATEAEPGDLLSTSVGGLFFLVPLLDQVGLPRILEMQPALAQCGLPWHLFRAAMRIGGAPEEDALWQIPDPQLPWPRGSLWRWLLAAHHRCRGLTGFSLCGLIQRPALVGITETHIDIFFGLRDADLRIRRAGLDIDRGWVPWLRRIITFHYNRN